MLTDRTAQGFRCQVEEAVVVIGVFCQNGDIDGIAAINGEAESGVTAQAAQVLPQDIGSQVDARDRPGDDDAVGVHGRDRRRDS